jgi:hypothetical protein
MAQPNSALPIDQRGSTFLAQRALDLNAGKPGTAWGIWWSRRTAAFLGSSVPHKTRELSAVYSRQSDVNERGINSIGEKVLRWLYGGRRAANCGHKGQQVRPAVRCSGELAEVEKALSTSVEGGIIASIVSNIGIAIFAFFSIAIVSSSITVLSGERMTTDLYVSMNGSDSNSGTAGAPFRTILKASQVAQPGTTVHVAPGDYAGGFKTTASGTASAPIHYVSDTKWGADIVPAANSTYDMGWDNRGAFVIIDGFEVNGSNYQGGTAWREGLYTTGSYSALTNNNVHNIAWNVPSTSQGGAGIEGDSYFGGTNINLIGNIVHDIGPASDNTIHGIYQTAPGNVENNLVYRTSGWGIALWHDANHINIVNNTVFNNASGGITVGGGDFVHSTGPADYVKVANNIVYDNKVGIDEYGSTGTHNVYTDNLVSGSGTNFSLQNGLVATNTITADPKFVNYIATGGGDYHLAAGSPAIDAGTSSGAPSSDLDGNARMQGAGYDIGAYEYVPTRF